MNPYLTVSEADDYFEERLSTTPWDSADDDKKLKSLKQATRMIDRLNFAGEVLVDGQELQFPRKNINYSNVGAEVVTSDATVPQDIKDATCEIAISLLDGWDMNVEHQNLAAQSQGFSNVRTSYDRGAVLDYIKAGIPCFSAWALLRPYLRDPNSVVLIRDS